MEQYIQRGCISAVCGGGRQVTENCFRRMYIKILTSGYLWFFFKLVLFCIVPMVTNELILQIYTKKKQSCNTSIFNEHIQNTKSFFFVVFVCLFLFKRPDLTSRGF